VDGVLVDEEMPSYLHEFVIAWLITRLGSWAAVSGAIVAGLGAKFGVAGGPRTEAFLANVPGCEGLRIDVGGLWAEIDALTGP
jgi:hypothetical protein